MPHHAQLPIDAGLLSFDRDSGSYLLQRGPAFADNQRRAPTVLQVGLLTPCNLSCHFCYRDTKAPSRLEPEFLVPLLQAADAWGVLEVAFGGGEPLLYKGFVPMLQELHQSTQLGLNFTTNGLLLTDAVIDTLQHVVGEVRISAYHNNRYRDALKRAQKLSTGLNLLVTPSRIGQLEALVYDAMDCGADNVVLLAYKGDDPSLHLNQAQRDQLGEAVYRMRDLDLRLDICWYPYFPDLPHLFQRGDCGAGEDFLVITPDRAVQSCSFGQNKAYFETFEDLQEIYRSLARTREHAQQQGCTRHLFQPLPTAQPEHNALWLWKARASNNSSTWTLIAQFVEEDTAEEAAKALQVFFSELHQFYLQSSEANGRQQNTLWRPVSEYEGRNQLPPPVARFIEKYQLGLTSYRHGITDTTEEPSIFAVGKQLLVHHRYCLALDEDLFQAFVTSVGQGRATARAYGLDHTFLLQATATGQDDEVSQCLLDFFTLPEAHFDMGLDGLPWPAREPVAAQMLQPDIDEEDAVFALQDEGGQLLIRCLLCGDIGGAAHSLEEWLVAKGFGEVRVALSVYEGPGW